MSKNVAKLMETKIFDKTGDPDWTEEYVYILKDKSHVFEMGFSMILTCLFTLRNEGLIPKLPDDWVGYIRSRYQNIRTDIILGEKGLQYEDIDICKY